MRLIAIIFVFIFSFSFSQSLDWSYVNTGSNATIAISSDDFPNITFNGSSIPDGALIGVFYEDNNDDYACGGYNTWDSSGTISVTAWGTESGLDNGFAIGESYTWFLQIDGEDYRDFNGRKVISWFWLNEEGKYFLSINYGKKPIELSKGKFSVICESLEEVKDSLNIIEQCVSAQLTIRLCIGFIPSILVIIGLLIMRKWDRKLITN